MEVAIRDAIIKELESIGIILEKEEDIDLLSLEMDSMMFISFIVSLEDRFDIQIPDEFLQVDVMSSLDNLTKIIGNLLAR